MLVMVIASSSSLRSGNVITTLAMAEVLFYFLAFWSFFECVHVCAFQRLPCVFDFGFLFVDEIEEDALNAASCVQVLRILITKADTEIEELEKDLLSLQDELALAELENWPEVCCGALTERIKWLDVAVRKLKDGNADGTEMQLLLSNKPAETLNEILKALHRDRCCQEVPRSQVWHLKSLPLNVIFHFKD